MIPRDFFFSELGNFWHLLWLIPLLGLIVYAYYQRKKTAETLVDQPLSKEVMVQRSPFWSILAAVCFVLGWLFSVLALMGPMGNEYYLAGEGRPRQERTPLELYLVIDVSQSMAVTDARGTKSRLDSALEIADRLAAQLKNDSVAVFAFTSALVPFVPLTYDLIFVRLMLKELELNAGDHYGTNFPVMFEQLKKQLFEMYPKAPKAIVLFSDGGDLAIEAASRSERKRELASLIEIARSLNTPIFTVGIGSLEGGKVPDLGRAVISRLDDTLLKALSQQTGGQYFAGNTQVSEEIASAINQALERLRINAGAKGVVASASRGYFHYYFQIPLILALAFLGLSFLMPRTSALVILFFFPFYSFATSPGEALYDAGKYKEAAEWFSLELKHLPPEWLRNKLLYNLGTSLMAEKRWQEAERAFFAISKEAYAYPLFRARLLYNQILALHAQGLNVSPLIQMSGLNELQLKEGPKELEPLTLFRLAALLQKPSPELASALASMPPSDEVTLAKKALEENNLDAAAFYLDQLEMNTSETPAAFLEASLAALAIASSLPNGNERVAENARRFYPLVLEWQKQQFSKGECQCKPWDRVLPRFTEGLRMLEQKPFERQLFYTYEKWLEALEMLQEPRPSQEEKQPEKSDLRELREMQALDKHPKAKMKPVGGMLW